jgi:putative oxidoreductase
MTSKEQYRQFFFNSFRIGISLLLFIHGVARIWFGGVEPFGTFLTHVGFPFGYTLAWSITIFELVGSFLMAVGRFNKQIAIGFILELLGGIILVHAQHGWFVVGHSSNGVEYNISLISSLILIWAMDQFKDDDLN